MKVSVFDIINSDLAVNYDDGILFFDKIKSLNPDGLVISFQGISHLSTLFLNESIGKFAILHKEVIDKLHFEFPSEKQLFNSKVNNVIENALMGSDYDELVDAAKMAL